MNEKKTPKSPSCKRKAKFLLMVCLLASSVTLNVIWGYALKKNEGIIADLGQTLNTLIQEENNLKVLVSRYTKALGLLSEKYPDVYEEIKQEIIPEK